MGTNVNKLDLSDDSKQASGIKKFSTDLKTAFAIGGSCKLTYQNIIEWMTSLQTAISYWANIEWPFDLTPEQFPESFEDRDCYDARAAYAMLCGEYIPITDNENGLKYKLYAGDIISAVVKIIKNGVYTTEQLEDYDDTVVDCIVQSALFGSVIYS